MPLERDLLETAKRLAKPHNPRGRPRQADLRRAISTAYYAVFHALCRMCADAFVGNRSTTRRAWEQVYRSVEHGCSYDKCVHGIIGKEFPDEVKSFCGAFIHLQEKRYLADYAPFSNFKLSDVQQAIALAEDAINSIRKDSLDLKHRRAFAAWLLLRRRKA